MTECALRTRAYRRQIPFHLNARRIVFMVCDLREIAEGEPHQLTRAALNSAPVGHCHQAGKGVSRDRQGGPLAYRGGAARWVYGAGVPVVAVLVGLQASGKTTFCQRVLGAGPVVVSKAHFPNARHPQRRQMRLIDEALSAGRDVVVDNTNPSPQEWAPLVEAARSHGARVVAYWFPPDLVGSSQRNAARPDRVRVPEVGLRATLASLQHPRVRDGFDEVFAVEFDGAGGFVVRPAGEGGAGGKP